MHKVLKLVLFFFFSSTSFHTEAQNKYAVLLAINDYYTAPGVKSDLSLHGCVNDALSMKELLTGRFGFDASNIYTLLNEAATKKSFIDLMLSVIRKCKAGDAVVFFYSGHGVWMSNHTLDLDPVKRGMSQAIVMSDLYSPGWDCLVRDETLKDLFNQFINKKIILTTLFDCCFSGNLPAMFQIHYWTPDGYRIANEGRKDIFETSIPFMPQEQQPSGCKVDASGKLLDSTDSDHDGVPDCKDWEVHSLPNSTVDSLGVTVDFKDEDFFLQPDNYFDPKKFAEDSSGSDERSFNLTSALQVANRSSQRPADRMNSQFLSLSGTRDTEKGLEVTDISGLKHGAFTAAILQVYRRNPPTLPVSELNKKLLELMSGQWYRQMPQFHLDSARLKGNLLGIPPSGFSNNIKAICISNNKGVITINKGLTAGITKGNSLVSLSTKQKIEITNVYNDSATALDKTNGRVKPGETFELKDDYTVSPPMIKVYIPSAQFTPTSFQAFLKNKIAPAMKEKNYGDYNAADDMRDNSVFIWKDASRFTKTDNHYGFDPNNSLQYHILPIPSFVADQLRQLLRKDQNIELVDDPKNAQYGFYLNYAKTDSSKTELIFYLHPIISGKINSAAEIFSDECLKMPVINEKNAASLAKDLYHQTIWLLRQKTNNWMNTYPRR